MQNVPLQENQRSVDKLLIQLATAFDSELKIGFRVELGGIYLIGSLVRLNSGRLAVVTENHENALQNPVVKVFYSTKSNARVKIERLDLNDNTVTDRLANRETAGQPIIWTNCVACASPLTVKASNWWSGLKQEYID